MENGRARRRRARQLKRQRINQQPKPRENWDVTFSQSQYEPEESEADWEVVPEVDYERKKIGSSDKVLSESEMDTSDYKVKTSKNKNGNAFVRWVNTNVDNVRLGLGILIFIMCALLLNNNINVKTLYNTSAGSFYDVLVMGKLDADLTRTAREYVITKNDKYKKLYDDYLLIRNGVSPDRNGEKKSYEDRFDEIPTNIIPEAEKDKLNQSLQESDFLALKEKDAMDLIDSEEEGNYEKAIQLVFGDEYDRQKDKIMNPLLDFTDNLRKNMKLMILNKLHFSYGYVIILCLANLMLIFLINDRLDLSIRDEE